MIPTLPPLLSEAKSSPREVVKLINQMRAQMVQVRQLDLAGATVLTAVPLAIWISDDMPTNSLWDVELMALGLATDGSAGGYRRIGRFKRAGGGSSAVHAVGTPVPDAASVGAWDVTMSANANGVQVLVTGDASRTVSWSALVKVRELKQ